MSSKVTRTSSCSHKNVNLTYVATKIVCNLIFIRLLFQADQLMNEFGKMEKLFAGIFQSAIHNELNDHECNRNHALKKPSKHNRDWGDIFST